MVWENCNLFFFLHNRYTIKERKKANKEKTEKKKISHDMTPLNEHEFALRDVFMTSVA